jgi:hypothetical protein
MARIKYEEKRFSPRVMRTIEQANAIIEEYNAEGLTLTLRQLYYQFVSRDLIPNRQDQYRRLSRVISDGRLAGLIDWFAIVDRTRNLMALRHYADPGEAINFMLRSFILDRREAQLFRPEVWIEKEALVGVISQICNQLDVPYFACKGYTSQSEMWGAGQRFNRYLDRGQRPVIIHLGDHDPSGIDMTRDIVDRQGMFADDAIIVERIALNMDQVEQYNPPPNPAKLTDSRSTDYISEYGRSSWELDALEPRVIRQLIETTVARYTDHELMEATLERERRYRNVLRRVADNWETL